MPTSTPAVAASATKRRMNSSCASEVEYRNGLAHTAIAASRRTTAPRGEPKYAASATARNTSGSSGLVVPPVMYTPSAIAGTASAFVAR